MCAKSEAVNEDLKSVGALPKDDVVEHQDACASETAVTEDPPKISESVPPKKRKTRRGKCKRRNMYPYAKNFRKSNKVIKPEAPHNSNQFLLEDHGNIEELDQKLKCIDQASSSTVTRTRDSSFSVDTVDSDADGDFYSSPEDEKEFLIKDFDDQYETLHAERLCSMSKNELIQGYLSLEAKVDQLTKRLLASSSEERSVDNNNDRDYLQSEIERLTMENDRLKRENVELAKKVSLSCSSDSADSETDSSDSCSSSISSMSRPESPVDYAQTNGHSPTVQTI